MHPTIVEEDYSGAVDHVPSKGFQTYVPAIEKR